MASRRRPDDPALAAALAEGWERLVVEVDRLPDEVFATPSRMPGWTVAELVAHTACSLAATTSAVTGPSLDRADVDVTGYLMGAPPEAPTSGLPSVDDARTALRTAARVASAVLVDADLDRVVTTPGGAVRLGDFLVTRAVEAVVHGLDLGVTPTRGSLRIVVRAFVDAFAAAAPGHAVELRVPPFAAAQVVAGPRHTRGTPPNVVEANPVAFVELVVGRLAWSEAVADGLVRASGERSDLSGHLPLI